MKAAVAPLAQDVPPTALDEVVAQLNDAYIEKGTPMFMRTVLALFSGGFATFALLYCVQPMMPALSHEFSINAAQSSLILSLATAMLAFGLLITGPISDTLGRKPVMVAALFCAATATIASGLMPTWEGILHYYQKNEAYMQGQLGNPEGADKPNKKYYDPRPWLRAAQQTMIERLEKTFTELNCVNVL